MPITYAASALTETRTRKGLRVDELAARARVSERQIRNIEHGAIPRADTLAKLAAALGVSIRTFYAEQRGGS